MYENATILAACVLIYSIVAGPVERSWVSGPMVFIAAGFLLGPQGLDLLHPAIKAEGLRTLAEFTLAMVLFTDAANADFAIVRRSVGLPNRLLLIGLPLTIILGFLAAMVLFPGLRLLEMALLAATLAPTDAALGKPVVTNPAVPSQLREALNLESGLNDGICVPVIVILLGLAIGTQIEGSSLAHMTGVVAEQIGIGLAVGLGLTAAAALVLSAARRWGWIGHDWAQIPFIALAALCFAAAQVAGGSGFIACFSGGLLLSALPKNHKQPVLHGAEGTGAMLALMTWVVFGTVAVGLVIDRFTWPLLAYAVLSLTVIRMLPVFLCLTGSGMSYGSRLFVGWFGPRGLASIVFGVLILHEKLPGNDTVIAAVACTVLLSVIAHGITANPLVQALSRRAVR
jgi:sodium/hydrogen antiporter